MGNEEASIGYKFELTSGDTRTSVMYFSDEPWHAETWNLIMDGRDTTIVVGSGEIITTRTTVNFSVYGDDNNIIVSTVSVPVELCRQVFGSPSWRDHTWRHQEKKEGCNMTIKDAKILEEFKATLYQEQYGLDGDQSWIGEIYNFRFMIGPIMFWIYSKYS